MAGKGKPGPAKGTKPKEGVNTGNMGKGRPKNTPNKVTARAREVIGEVLDNTAPCVQGWFREIAETDPKGALQAYISMLEFGVPKLARTEITGIDGGAVVIRQIKMADDDGE